MGAGKSTIGELLGKKLKHTAVFGEDRIKWFITDFRRTLRNNAIVRSVMIEMCKEYLKQGINLVVTQGFSRTHRPLDPFVKMAKANNAKLLLYHLNAPRQTLLKRLDDRKKTKSPARIPIAQSRIHRNLRYWNKNRYNHGKEIATDKMNAKQVVNQILKDLKS